MRCFKAGNWRGVPPWKGFWVLEVEPTKAQTVAFFDGCDEHWYDHSWLFNRGGELPSRVGQDFSLLRPVHTERDPEEVEIRPWISDVKQPSLSGSPAEVWSDMLRLERDHRHVFVRFTILESLDLSS